MALQLIPKRRTLPNPFLIRLFSTSSSDNPADSDDRNDQPKSSSSSANPADSDDRNDQSKSSFSSYFSDVKSSLRRQNQSPPSPRRPPRPPSSPNTYFAAASSPSKVASLEEIRKNLTELRIRSEASGPTNSTPPPSFQDSYMKNALRKPNASSDAAKSGSKSLSFDAIRESLKKMRPSDDRTDMRGTDQMSFPPYKSSLKFKPSDSPPPPPRTTIIGGTEALSSSLFGKETKEKTKEEISAMKTEFVRTYGYQELGEKLKKLRPEGKGKGEGWFSMEELNERLMRLREMDDKEEESRIAGIAFRDIRETLVGIKLAEAEKVKKNTIDKFDILSQLGRTSSFTMQPPKEHLVEKYFHPDNMSSAEKMKIELSKVRDGFKMSESDCGSARVQVAQLTTKIKHLSSVLHKKDKHSRKGLIAMVQRRKRLLKYLRRTDWDSYCFVLDKLGLRDNPDYKN